MNSNSVVWILGAGFSKALGGPLIYDLLRFVEDRVLGELLPPDQGLRDANRIARSIFKDGREAGLWDHAETFLDMVEQGALEEERPAEGDRSHSYRLLKDFTKRPAIDNRSWPPNPANPRDILQLNVPDLKTLARHARRALATDCFSFLCGANPRTERWQPYVRWASRLTRDDTVITFNYDAVPEVLAQQPGVMRTPGFGLQVITPGAPMEDGDLWMRADAARRASVAPVLKLHGSLNWIHEPGGAWSTRPEVQSWDLLQSDADLLLGVPGPGKRNTMERLDPLWTMAEEAIRGACAIVFLGYRFPPSDSDARERILAAIGGNVLDPAVVTVLGPPSVDSQRLSSLIAIARRGECPIMSPLFAEDFIHLVDRKWLLDRGLVDSLGTCVRPLRPPQPARRTPKTP